MLSALDVRYFKLAVGQENIGKETTVDIVARCPVCGDSQKNKRSKRLHLYTKNNVTKINCFNGSCEVNNKTTFGFLKSFFPNLLENYKRENFVQNLQHLTNQNEDVFANIAEEVYDSHNNKQLINKTKPVQIHNLFQYFENILEHEEALAYLHKRGLDYFNSSYEWYFGKQNLEISDKLYKLNDAIIIPLYYEEEMYGFYSRNIYSKDFYTYMPEANVGFKVWNWFQVNKEQEVYIFEGIFDAISSGLPNCIALMGAKIPDERLKELKKPVFVLDNDKTGILNSIEYSKKGYSVYIQPNDLKEKDMNELSLNHLDLNISEMILSNIYNGISAEIRLKAKL